MWVCIIHLRMFLRSSQRLLGRMQVRAFRSCLCCPVHSRQQKNAHHLCMCERRLAHPHHMRTAWLNRHRSRTAVWAIFSYNSPFIKVQTFQRHATGQDKKSFTEAWTKLALSTCVIGYPIGGAPWDRAWVNDSNDDCQAFDAHRPWIHAQGTACNERKIIAP